MSQQSHPVDRTAVYTWGSMWTRFAGLIGLERRDTIQFLVALESQVGEWNSTHTFAHNVAILHECVHYLQDCTTGIGHWDAVVANTFLPRLLSFSRQTTLSDFIRPALAVPLFERWRSESILIDPAEYSDERKAALFRNVSRLLGAELTAHNSVPFYVSCLLESDAVAATLSQLLALKLSPVQSSIFRSESALIVPSRLPDEYSATLLQITGSLENTLGNSSDGYSPEESMVATRLYLNIAGFLMDLAVAHPSMQLLESANADRFQYEPGLKLFRLLKALMHLSEENTAHFLEAMRTRRPDFRAAEILLLHEIDFPYLSSERIYTDWITVLGELAERTGDRMFDVRRQTCQQRVRDPNSYVLKHLSAAMSGSLPVLHVTGEGYFLHVSGGGGYAEFMDQENRVEFVIDVCKHLRDHAVVDLFLRGRAYRCPFAMTGLCSAKEDTCTEGIQSPRDLPRAPECAVRGGLEECGFALDR